MELSAKQSHRANTPEIRHIHSVALRSGLYSNDLIPYHHISLTIICQFISLELADKIEMFFHLSFRIVYIHIQ